MGVYGAGSPSAPPSLDLVDHRRDTLVQNIRLKKLQRERLMFGRSPSRLQTLLPVKAFGTSPSPTRQSCSTQNVLHSDSPCGSDSSCSTDAKCPNSRRLTGDFRPGRRVPVSHGEARGIHHLDSLHVQYGRLPKKQNVSMEPPSISHLK